MPTALFSLSDKTGLVDFARDLDRLGWDLLASGGTAAVLKEAGLPVQEIAEYTRSPEILGGRVKTLHPVVHAGILARPIEADSRDLELIHARQIDLVVVNLYPFQETAAQPNATLEEIVENIDIGGVALIRAAAKNFARVTILIDPADYPDALAELSQHGEVPLSTRQRLAKKAFAHTAGYDADITAYFERLAAADSPEPIQEPLALTLFPISTLRYGENPHQEAKLYTYAPHTGPLGGQLLQGKALSYNNLLDLDAAWRSVVLFDRPTVSIVKHLSPCGIASGDTLAGAYPLALASDPVSAFGGVIAVNRTFDAVTAEKLGDLFVEGIAAPGFADDALEILSSRKNLRLVSLPDTQLTPGYELRSIHQGVLCQSLDRGDPTESGWRVATKRQPTFKEWQALRFAWKACQQVRSNAIVLAQGEATVGIGGGQPNRVDCVRIAALRAGEKANGAVMASDAFFPFPDSVEEAARLGITAIIQPGGSVKDEQSIAAADAHQMTMVLTGFRHFRH